MVLKNSLERINTKLHSKSCYYLYSLTTIFSSKLRKINQCIAANLIPGAGYRNIKRNLLEKHTLYTASKSTVHCRLGRILPRSHEKLSDNSKVFSPVCICRNFVDVVHCYFKGRICPEDLNVMPLGIIHRYVRQLGTNSPL